MNFHAINLQPEMLNHELHVTIREKDLLYKALSAAQQVYLMKETVLICKNHGPCILPHQYLVLVPPVQKVKLRICSMEKALLASTDHLISAKSLIL